MNMTSMQPKDKSTSIFKKVQRIIDPDNRNKNKKDITQMSTFEFDQEIQSLAQQLREKVISLNNDYNDLKIFQNEGNIASVRGKLTIFLRKLITETSHLIEQIEKDFKKNKKVMKKIERRMDQIDRDKKQREIKKNELRNE